MKMLLGGALLVGGASLSAQQTAVPASASIAPPEHPATAAQVKEYYELSQMQTLITGMINQMVKGMRLTSQNTVPASVWDQMTADFGKYDFLAAITPAYQKYISEEDMAVTIAYMKSDAAKRIQASQPFIQSVIADATRKAGQEIGEKAARDHMDEIQALQKKSDEAAAARANGGAHPEIVLPSTTTK